MSQKGFRKKKLKNGLKKVEIGVELGKKGGLKDLEVKGRLLTTKGPLCTPLHNRFLDNYFKVSTGSEK